MEQALPTSPHSLKSCEVCDQTLPFMQDTCRQPECRSVMSQKSRLTPIAYQNLLMHERQIIQAKQEKKRLQEAHQSHVDKTEDDQNQRIIADVVQNGTIDSSEHIHVINLPSGPETITLLSETRKQRFFDHLKIVIAEARQYASVDDVPFDQHANARQILSRNEATFAGDPKLEATCNALCMTCKGGCCPEGADHAFVSAITIRRELDNNANLSDEDILETYKQHMSDTVLEGGCINQTTTGCALPRELRSDVCNSYFCSPLKQLQRNGPDKDGRYSVFAVQRSNNNWNRYAVDNYNPVVGKSLVVDGELSAFEG